jgi:hypothetical protein
MKYVLTLLLTFVLTGYSQNKLTYDIDQYVKRIESNSELLMNEYDWNKITGGQVDHGATLTIWKIKNFLKPTIPRASHRGISLVSF